MIDRVVVFVWLWGWWEREGIKVGLMSSVVCGGIVKEDTTAVNPTLWSTRGRQGSQTLLMWFELLSKPSEADDVEACVTMLNFE